MPQHDFTREVRAERRRGLRALYVVLGLIFTGLGIAGVILPLVPGTPMLLIALFFYARASSRLYNWLLNNRLVGPTLHAWRNHRRMPRRVKPRAIFAVVLAFSLSAAFALSNPWLRLGWLLLGAGVVCFIWRLPTYDERLAPGHGSHASPVATDPSDEVTDTAS